MHWNSPASARMKTKNMTDHAWAGSRSSGKNSFKYFNLPETLAYGFWSFRTMYESWFSRLCCTMSLQPLPNSISISPQAIANPFTWSFKLSDSVLLVRDSDTTDAVETPIGSPEYRIPVSSTRLASSSRHVFDPDISLKITSPHTHTSMEFIHIWKKERERDASK